MRDCFPFFLRETKGQKSDAHAQIVFSANTSDVRQGGEAENWIEWYVYVLLPPPSIFPYQIWQHESKKRKRRHNNARNAKEKKPAKAVWFFFFIFWAWKWVGGKRERWDLGHNEEVRQFPKLSPSPNFPAQGWRSSFRISKKTLGFYDFSSLQRLCFGKKMRKKLFPTHSITKSPTKK